MKRAYYSILRYCPDPVRGELFNVGVIAVGANAFRLRLAERFGPLRRYAGSFDEALLERHGRAVEEFFRQRPFYLRQADGHKSTVNRPTREVLLEFVSQHLGPRLCYGPVCRVEGNIDSPFALANLTDDLCEQFIERRPTVSSDPRHRKERIKTMLRNEFDACDFFNPEKYRCPMAVDDQIELPARGYSLPVSFSFNNGVLHAFEAIDALADAEPISQLKDVALVAMIFQKLRAELGDRVRTYACLVRPPDSPRLRELRILGEHAKVIDFAHRARRERFCLALHRRLKPRSPDFLQF